jgi:hypothetical protein
MNHLSHGSTNMGHHGRMWGIMVAHGASWSHVAPSLPKGEHKARRATDFDAKLVFFGGDQTRHEKRRICMIRAQAPPPAHTWQVTHALA